MAFRAHWPSVTLFGIALGSVRTVCAAEEPAELRRVQLGVSLNLVGYQRASFDVTPLNSGRTFAGGLTRTSYGPSASAVTIEPGIVLGGRWVLGLLIDLGSQQADLVVKGMNAKLGQSIGSFAIGPRALYLFNPDSSFRPYALLAFGYTTTPSEQEQQVINLTEYQGFAGFGTHWFLDPAFSLDMSLRGAYGLGSGYVDYPPLENTSLDGSVFSVIWTLGTSGWLR